MPYPLSRLSETSFAKPLSYHNYTPILLVRKVLRKYFSNDLRFVHYGRSFPFAFYVVVLTFT